MKNFEKIVKLLVLNALCFFSLLPVIAQDNKLSDAEIASVAVVANQNDIEFAEIAMERSNDPDVLNFAETMATDHKAVIDLAVALVTKLNVTPKDNALSQQLLSNAEKTKAMLRSKSAEEFDKAYVDNEVVYHTAVVGAVENVLIPQSQNMELKQLLKQALAILKTHQHHAEMLQEELAKE